MSTFSPDEAGASPTKIAQETKIIPFGMGKKYIHQCHKFKKADICQVQEHRRIEIAHSSC